MSRPSERQMLIADYASGTIDAESLQRLESALRSDAHFRRNFVEYMNVDSAISDVAAISDSEFDAMSSEHLASANSVVMRQSSLKTTSLMIAIAAAALLIVGLFWFKSVTGSGASAATIPLEVVSLDSVQWVDFDSDIKTGDWIALNRIQLTSGAIQVRLESGIALDLSGPMDATFESPMRLRIARGRVNADIGESGHGFTIVTDHGEIVDLGTRFGVDVKGDEASLAVFDGKVKVKSDGNASARGPLNVLEGEGVRLRKGQQPRRLSAVWLSQEKLGLSASDTSSIVVDVSDNADTDGFHRFYGIIAGGMRDGTIAYTTHASTPRRDVVWQAAKGEDFPSELINADVVCPFHIDRREQSLTISLQLAGPADIYVMQDQRRKPSAWLKENFRKTELKLRSGPWRPVSPLAHGIEPDSEGGIYVPYSVWTRRVDAAGIVELGPPQADGDRANNAMFGIAVKRTTGNQ
ncbi:FecR protein [Rubripirellula amarantea]|uniref:FecR protein n=1 Tax=Rubripirellula amarantea TaxID=2527999 RepID=A0A5C5WXT5_9BACT|nr:FecR domain-containing protein [Rubripirellula amarantea]TWT54813.1 FecR protein [Rubripirellula amarantea]